MNKSLIIYFSRADENYAVGYIDKVFDLFPRTDKGKNRCVSRQKHALINSRERPQKSDINLEQSGQAGCIGPQQRGRRGF